MEGVLGIFHLHVALGQEPKDWIETTSEEVGTGTRMLPQNVSRQRTQRSRELQSTRDGTGFLILLIREKEKSQGFFTVRGQRDVTPSM
ncbi:hypothetical protein GOP47_0024921 [Adiantum capillus-veneris]|uniref:Uncharacterized protein n=1 Tax=Adiantum capillus-veneris TaxID=13818 RepID=A0A9D4U2P3_ADICA|nr:hypothetical protein GOP47_0024921 [Adiantum capillus-veneris]